MCVVAIVTTGDLEFRALADFLQKLFPTVEFRSEKGPSFTSARVRGDVLGSSKAQAVVERLAGRLVAAIDPGRKSKHEQVADFALAIDDLELFNADQPELVVKVFCAAVRRHVSDFWPSQTRRDKAYARLREAASFHLLSPMVEAYFYADPDALQSAGAKQSARVKPNCDLESFQTADPDYEHATQHLACPAENWSATAWYPRHPKHYLNYLHAPDDPYDPDPKAAHYKETEHGVAALRQLSPPRLFDVREHMRFLRSLLTDLADALQLDRPYSFDGDCHPVTFLPGGKHNTLRNV